MAQHDGDILLSVVEGRIVTGTEGEAGDPPPERRVFPAELGDLGENSTNEPGFDSEVGVFAPGSSLGFRLRGPLRRWNGADFNAAGAEQIAVTLSLFPPLGPVFTPTIPGEIVTGFTVQVLAAGDWHHHLEYTLTAPAEPGIYLLELSMFSTDPAVAESRPLWLVINKQRPEAEHEAATDAAEYVYGRVGCLGDWDRNRVVEPADIGGFVAQWLSDVSSGGLAADVDENGTVEPVDIAVFIGAWFAGVGGC
ncbi:MAG: hypothetical protein KF745_08495 [Phycisphaeraceae bacterium]|nr:hypothetical protein [Phycisphaeraceae bacterium]